MFSKQFFLAALERAIKTFVQTFLAILTSQSVGVAAASAAPKPNLSVTGVTGALAALLSIATSIAGSGVNNPGPSVTSETIAPAPADISGLTPIDPTAGEPSAVVPA